MSAIQTAVSRENGAVTMHLKPPVDDRRI